MRSGFNSEEIDESPFLILFHCYASANRDINDDF